MTIRDAATDRDPRAVFPGGFLPTLTFMVETLTKGSQGRLVVDAVSNIGPHYARTLREWRRRFEARFDEVVVPGAPRLPRVLLFLCRSADWRASPVRSRSRV